MEDKITKLEEIKNKISNYNILGAFKMLHDFKDALEILNTIEISQYLTLSTQKKDLIELIGDFDDKAYKLANNPNPNINTRKKFYSYQRRGEIILNRIVFLIKPR